LRIKNAKLEPKELSRALSVPVPPLLEEDFQVLCDTIAHPQENTPAGEDLKQTRHIETVPPIDSYIRAQKIDSWISVANIERKLGNPPVDISIEDEVTECFMILKGQF
jgi:diphthine-ammonia ligase